MTKRLQSFSRVFLLALLIGSAGTASGGDSALRMALVASKSVVSATAVNLENHLNWIDKAVAQGAEFVGFPECSLTGYKFGPGYGIALDSPEVTTIIATAREKGIYVSVGLAEKSETRWYNTHVLAGPDGVVAIMHKISLVSNSAGEATYCTAGTEYPVFDIQGIRMGIAICADATYFPPIQQLAANGAQAIFVPHATYLNSTPQSWINWRMLSEDYPWPQYAQDLNVYLIGCNNAGLYSPSRPGETDNLFASGALVVGPDGSALAQSTITVNVETMLMYDLPIPERPVIVSGPVDRTVAEGEQADFSVVTTNESSLSFQWYFNGSAVAGATNTTFTVTNAQVSDAGAYSVAVANSAGSVTSNPAILKVITAERLDMVVAADGVQLVAEGLRAGSDYIVESSEDLKTWQQLTSLSAVESIWYFNDPDAGSHSARFYRLQRTLPSQPSPPTGLGATAGDGQASLSWSPAAGAAGYNVKRRLTGQGSYGVIASGVTATVYVDGNLVNGTSYEYVVSAVNAGGESADSQGVSVTPVPGAPAAPTGLTATAGDGQASLSWSPAAGAAGYNVKRRLTGQGSYGVIASGVTATVYVDGNLVNGTSYEYVVSAVNAGGESADSQGVSVTPVPGAPAAPTGLGATAGDGQASLSWSPAAGAASYNVKRRLTGQGSYGVIASGVTATVYVDGNLVNGTSYEYVVSAVNAGGESADSQGVSVTPVPGAPAAPTGLTATAISRTQINLKWNYASNDVDGFKLERSTDRTTWTQIEGTSTLTGEARSYSNTGLSRNRNYYYRIRAVYQGQESDYSNIAGAKTFK